MVQEYYISFLPQLGSKGTSKLHLSLCTNLFLGIAVVYIPKTAVLSVKSCFFSQHISSVPYGHGAHLSLALALYGELCVNFFFISRLSVAMLTCPAAFGGVTRLDAA